MKPTRRLFALTTLACAALAATGTALAQFPDKPLRIVVGAPAGGTADIIARTLSEGLAQQLGQPVMVDNKPGGAGLIGLQEVLGFPGLVKTCRPFARPYFGVSRQIQRF